MKPAQPSLSMFLKKKIIMKPSFVSLVWLTNSHIILQSMMTYQIERLPVKRGLSGLSGLFRVQDIIFSDCDNQCERCGGGGGGECPLFLGHVRLIFVPPGTGQIYHDRPIQSNKHT